MHKTKRYRDKKLKNTFNWQSSDRKHPKTGKRKKISWRNRRGRRSGWMKKKRRNKILVSLCCWAGNLWFLHTWMSGECRSSLRVPRRCARVPAEVVAVTETCCCCCCFPLKSKEKILTKIKFLKLFKNNFFLDFFLKIKELN